MKSIEEIASLSKKNKKANEKFFQGLKRKHKKNVDALFQEAHEEVFSCTDCLSCANCCKTTGPLFTNKDIERISKHLKIKQQVFVEKYLRIDEDKDYVLQKLPCVFLDEENYCSIYEKRPKACREYPHTDREKQAQLLPLLLKNISVCPAAYEIVEKVKVKII